jgi:hypothetical protein
VAAELLLVQAGGVGRVGDVDCEGDVGADREGAGDRALQPDLLLDRGDRRHPPLQPPARVNAARRVERDVGAEPVVHRARDEPGAVEPHRVGGDHRRVADPDHLQGAVPVGGADVDVEALQLDRLLAIVLLEDVNRLAPDDADHGALAGLDLDPLADEDLRVPAADRREVEEALLVDVGDHEPDLVDVAEDREQRLRVGLPDRRDARADPVRADLGERRRLAPDGGGGRLVAGGRGRREQLLEQAGRLGHRRPTLHRGRMRD